MKEEIHNLHPNKEQILKLFVNNLDEINMKNDVGWTPLYRTIVADDCLATEILLEMGADPNVKSNVKFFFSFCISNFIYYSLYFKINAYTILFLDFFLKYLF